MDENQPPAAPARSIPAYCAVQDPDQYEREVLQFNAKRCQAAFAMQQVYRRAALVSTMANRGYLTVAQCEEFNSDSVPPLATYQPFAPTPVTPEELARREREQAERVERERRDLAKRRAQPVSFRTMAEACAFFGSNSEALGKYLDTHPELARTI